MNLVIGRCCKKRGTSEIRGSWNELDTTEKIQKMMQKTGGGGIEKTEKEYC